MGIRRCKSLPLGNTCCILLHAESTIQKCSWIKHHFNILKAVVINTLNLTMREFKHKLEIFGELLTWSGVWWIFFFLTPPNLKILFFKNLISFICKFQRSTFKEMSVERFFIFILIIIKMMFSILQLILPWSMRNVLN